MARSADPEREEIWGTWEELLLACAVSRHGTGSWESVSSEIRSRTSPSKSLTAQSCLQRYRALQRRFAKPTGGAAAAINGFRDDGNEAESPPEVSWVEELRKLRVAELRLELERRDLSIGSLQLKVKRLQEERERESQSGGGKQDRAQEETPSSSSSPAAVAGDRVSGRGDGPSSGESNSTCPKLEENLGEEDGQKTEQAARRGGKASDPSGCRGEKEAAAAREASFNGSTEGAADQATRPQLGDSGESIAESKGGEASRGRERMEESSDVQSSASLSRRKRRLRKKAAASGGGSSSGCEAEAEEVSNASGVKSQPLISFLEIIRSDSYGSVFERRLESQETARYRSIVRRHVDLEIVEANLGGSGGSYSASEFFRDLLLLCANAMVFYPRDSRESNAAVHLHELVSKEMAATSRPPPKPKPSQKETTAVTTETVTAPAPAPVLPTPSPSPPAVEPQDTSTKPKLDLNPAGTLIVKSTPSAPLIACRKRSSISNKASTAAKEKEDKSESDRKDRDKDKDKDKDRDSEDMNLTKNKAGKDKPIMSGTTRGLRTNKSRSSIGNAGAAAKRPNLAPTPSVKSKPAPQSTAAETSGKGEKKKNNNGGGGSGTPTAIAASSANKKQSAASFLNRINRSSNGTLAESVKTPSPGSGKGAEQKKTVKGGDARKDQGSGSRQGGGGGGSGKKVEDTSGSGKRSVGRPPKRPAPSPTPPPAKRAREDAESAPKTPSSSAAARKRGRK